MDITYASQHLADHPPLYEPAHATSGALRPPNGQAFSLDSSPSAPQRFDVGPAHALEGLSSDGASEAPAAIENDSGVVRYIVLLDVAFQDALADVNGTFEVTGFKLVTLSHVVGLGAGYTVLARRAPWELWTVLVAAAPLIVQRQAYVRSELRRGAPSGEFGD